MSTINIVSRLKKDRDSSIFAIRNPDFIMDQSISISFLGFLVPREA